jgi:DNA-binding transcriptional LysR family regulator
MFMNSLSLDAFYACVQTGSFTQAAKRLSITQSALSQRIKNLEEELATTLLIRDRAGLKLTETGERVVRYCKMKQEAETELKMHLQRGGKGGAKSQELNGLIRLGGYSSVNRSLIIPALAPLLRQHPGVSIRLVTKEMHELKPLLQSGEIDFMVLDHELKRDGLITKTIGFEKNVLIQKRGFASPDIYLDHDEDDLTTLNYLKAKPRAQVHRRYLDDIYGVIDGIKNGLGKAVVPLHLVHRLKDIEILNPEKSIKSPIVLHYFEQSFYSILHQEVVKALSQVAITSSAE